MSTDGTITVPVTCDVHIQWSLNNTQWALPLPQGKHDIGSLEVKVLGQEMRMRLTAEIRRPGGYVISTREWGHFVPHESLREAREAALAKIIGDIKSLIIQQQLASLTEWLEAQKWGWRREGEDIVVAKGAPCKTPKELEELARYLLDPPDDWHGKVRIEGGR